MSPATFWDKLFFDEAYNRGLYEALRFASYEVTLLEQRQGGVVRRVLRAEPPLDVPDFLKRHLRGRIYYVEDGTFDPAAGVWSFRNVPSVASDQIQIAGSIRVNAHPQGAEHVCELVTQVSGLGFGGAVAKFLVRNTRESYKTTVDYTNRYAAERGWLVHQEKMDTDQSGNT